MKMWALTRESTLRPALLMFDTLAFVTDVNIPGHDWPSTLGIDIPDMHKTALTEAVAVVFRPQFTTTLLHGIDPHVYKNISEAIAAVEPATIVPVYDSSLAFKVDIPPGDTTAYQAVINNIPVINENAPWEQIFEFRRDANARSKLRSLRLWLPSALAGKSLQESIDIIGKALADYEWALRKHGFETALGAVSYVLKSDTLAALTAVGGLFTLAGRPLWGLLTSGSLAISQAAVQIARHRIALTDLMRGVNEPVAAIHEIIKVSRGA